MPPIILAIESSCDETSASVIDNGKILSNIIASQTIHEKYGGVVPELASRAHQKNIVYVIDKALTTSSLTQNDLDAVAFTCGPGLMGSLLVGVSFAKAMALALEIPLIAINHMQAHVVANFIEAPKPNFPFICLTVSGGHTQLILVKDYLDLTIIGETQDDAAGEAFDKAAKIMGLSYPGGPIIDKLAKTGDPDAFVFPKTNMPALDFSFSGIKTAFLYFIKAQQDNNPSFVKTRKHDICASLQKHLIGMLLNRLEEASQKMNIKEIAIAGGVSANTGLRRELQARGYRLGWNVFIPAFQYCTDNAAMIAMTAHYKFMKGDFSNLNVSPQARMPING